MTFRTTQMLKTLTTSRKALAASSARKLAEFDAAIRAIVALNGEMVSPAPVAPTSSRGSRSGIIKANLAACTPGTTLRAMDILTGLSKTARHRMLAATTLNKAKQAGKLSRVSHGLYRVNEIVG